MARHRTFSTRYPPLPKFNTFIGAKYSFHTLGYLLRHATMESPNRRVFGFAFLIINQWLRWYSIQLDLLKCFVRIKAIVYILRGNAGLSTYIKLYCVMLYIITYDSIKKLYYCVKWKLCYDWISSLISFKMYFWCWNKYIYNKKMFCQPRKSTITSRNLTNNL